MCNFCKEDVLALAKAIVEDPINYQDGDHTPYYWCDYCEAELRGYYAEREAFKHDLSCPVLVANDVLTGFKK